MDAIRNRTLNRIRLVVDKCTSLDHWLRNLRPPVPMSDVVSAIDDLREGVLLLAEALEIELEGEQEPTRIADPEGGQTSSSPLPVSRYDLG